MNEIIVRDLIYEYKNLALVRQIYDLICLFWSLMPWKEKQSIILLVCYRY